MKWFLFSNCILLNYDVLFNTFDAFAHWQLTLSNHISFKTHTVRNIKESAVDYPYQDDVCKRTKVINKSFSGYLIGLEFTVVNTIIHL